MTLLFLKLDLHCYRNGCREVRFLPTVLVKARKRTPSTCLDSGKDYIQIKYYSKRFESLSKQLSFLLQ